MKYQILKYRLKTIEFWTLLLLLVVGSYFLVQALGMPFEMRRTIGPGFIPTIVLVALISFTFIALVQYLVNRNHKIFVNFPDGSEDDTTFKILFQALNQSPGTRLELCNHSGLGRFSALSVIQRSHPDTSLLAVSSRATQENAELAARQHLTGFTPFSLLYFDAYVLVKSASQGADDAALGSNSRIGYDSLIEDTVFLEKLKKRQDGQTSSDGQWQPMDIKDLRSDLEAGKLDAVVAARSDFEQAIQAGKAIVMETFDGQSTPSKETMLIYGEWAALFAPAAQARDTQTANVARLQTATQSEAFTAQLQNVQLPWQPSETTKDIGKLTMLAHQGTQGVTVKAKPARNRAHAIPVTLGAIALFPFLMNAIGFIATSILVTSLIMALLRAEFSLTSLVKIGVINVVIAVSTYLVFYHVFSIPLPLGSVW
ncbi:tripartite-type tricarboxylate transporter receptor subunit TctC [Vreelandella songnenensis]|uniref:Tripartite-type tricarboxylate transporter receptor subunit TctC n=1 Tax=Vreelandella songnenensis TaxID=1176243 RepID=A0A2T0V827_9GAMM|nr:tripartite tricarboxylate transporter TctB family protein [Halomonas songnenensis]PRY66208.1 tripartite-type tricarboxylate transporter receptor subunit TctC [Halomonas songnenensis]